jgi:hypothetical protein
MLMGLSAYKEITEWSDTEFVVPNHTYLFDGKSNILAYARASDGEVMVLPKPMKIDTRRRKFVKVNHKALQSLAKTLQSPDKTLQSDFPSWQVVSDSGKTYTVELIGNHYHCNCIGYAYRGKCKHSEEIKNENSN